MGVQSNIDSVSSVENNYNIVLLEGESRADEPASGGCLPTSLVPAIDIKVSWAQDETEAAVSGYSGAFQSSGLGVGVWDS